MGVMISPSIPMCFLCQTMCLIQKTAEGACYPARSPLNPTLTPTRFSAAIILVSGGAVTISTTSFTTIRQKSIDPGWVSRWSPMKTGHRHCPAPPRITPGMPAKAIPTCCQRRAGVPRKMSRIKITVLQTLMSTSIGYHVTTPSTILPVVLTVNRPGTRRTAWWKSSPIRKTMPGHPAEQTA